ncbi:MAG: TonB family protein [Polyangiaceae bacterium]
MTRPHPDRHEPVARWAAPSAWIASLVVHAALLTAGALVFQATSFSGAEPPPSDRPAPPSTLVSPDAVDLFIVSDGTRSPDALRLPYAPTLLARGGGEGEPRPDTGHPGRGGTDTAERRAVNLADRDDSTYLSRDVQTRVDRDQLPRIRSSKQRASWEDWRASREPMELTFLANGTAGDRPERRPSAPADPSQGAMDRGTPMHVGGAIGAAAPPPGEGLDPRLPGQPEPGADYASDGLGVRDGEPGHDFRSSAKVARARPMVDESDPSVPSSATGRPRDTQDSEQESTARSTSIVHASTAGGAPGAGPGGQSGPGPTGAGGVSGPGATSRTLGTGRGPGVDNSVTDPRRQLYLRSVQSKMQAAYNKAPRPFPTWAIVEGLQGTAVVTVVIRADGSIASASISRRSGVDEFDQNVRRIALGAGPMPAIPDGLGTTFTVSMPFVAKNPTVLPQRGKSD